MKSLLLTAVTSGLLVFGSGLLAPLHLAAADAPEVEWVRDLDEEYTGCVNATAGTTTSEGGFVFWGFTGNSVIMKVDSRGDVVWVKCPTEGHYASANAQLDDGGLLMWSIGTENYFEKWSRSGEMEWRIPDSTQEGVSGIAQLGDGSHVFCGTTNTTHEGFLQRMSAAGVIDPPVMIPDRWFHSIQRTSDGGAFVLGQDPWIQDVGETVLRFLKLDSAGYTEWETSLTVASDSVLARGPAIQLKSGDYVWGYSYTTDEVVNGAYVSLSFAVRLDALGNLISHEPGAPPWRNGIEVSNGDRVQLSSRGTGSEAIVSLARFSSGWETRWIVDVGKGSARNVQPTPDGGYLVQTSGETEDGSRVAQLVKLGPDPLNPPPLFIRGDANGDGAVDIADPVATLGFLFLGDSAPGCLEAANTNDDGEVDISDAVHTLNFLFLGGEPIPPPFPEEGIDPTSGPPGCFST